MAIETHDATSAALRHWAWLVKPGRAEGARAGRMATGRAEAQQRAQRHRETAAAMHAAHVGRIDGRARRGEERRGQAAAQRAQGAVRSFRRA